MLLQEVDRAHTFSIKESAKKILSSDGICSKIINAASLIFKLAVTAQYLINRKVLFFSGFIFSVILPSNAKNGLNNFHKVLSRDSIHDSGARKVANFVETVIFIISCAPTCYNIFAFFSGINLALDVLQ